MKIDKSEFLKLSDEIANKIKEEQAKTILERLSKFESEKIDIAQLITYTLDESKTFTIKYVNQMLLKLLSDND